MKKILVGISFLLIGVVSVYALKNNFSIDSSKLSFSSNSKKDSVINNFNDSYKLTHSITSDNAKLEEEIRELTKKTTYLLLGNFEGKDESSEDYYKRHQDYLNMGAYNHFPKDENSTSGYDESIANYRYASASELAVPSMFLKFNELGIKYNDYGEIRITINDNLVISTVFLPKVKMKEENASNPKEYNLVKTDLMITYYFLKINDEYKLAYLYGESGDDINKYFTGLENDESNNTLQVAPSYDSNLRQIYDYSKLDALSDQQLNSIYDLNKNNIVVLNSYYNNYCVATGNGFFINDGLIITTWSFLEKSLVEAQYITVKDGNGNSYGIDGIVTANPETDIAIIKLKEKINKKVNLGSSKELKTEEPVITISSKTSVGLTMQKGIIVSNDGYIQSAIPLSKSDEGSPLFDKNGNVIGINTSKQVNTNISLAINSDILKEVQDKFNKIDFDSIETIEFNQLKEKFYYVKYNDETVNNNIPKSKWNVFSKVGNIEKNITLELIKASYKNGVVSLRYKNGISNYISGMQLATSFKENLIKDGFKEELIGKEKCIYRNKNYQVIIMDEFDYLIVVMVKL